jgi:hypothetical protein
MATIGFNQLTIGSLARIGLICNACLWLPIGLLLGILSLFGLATTALDNVRTTGVRGLLTGILLGVILTLFGTLARIAGAGASRLAGSLLRGQTLQLKETAS